MGRPPISSAIVCHRCGSNSTSKAGFGKHRKQRFYCRSCRHWFIENPEIRTARKQSWKSDNLPAKRYLLAELKEIAHELGRTPTTYDWPVLREQDRVYPLYVYYAVFGSFLDALKSAKLKPRYKQEFDKAERERLLSELRDLYRRIGHPLLDEDVDEARRRNEISPPYHFSLAFGSVPAAIEAAGVGRKLYSRKEMIQLLRGLDSKLDRPIQGSDLQALYDSGKGPSLKAVLNTFGTIAKARKESGTKTAYRKAKTQTVHWQKYTHGELIEQLKRLGKKLGRKPTGRDINAASMSGECASLEPFTNMFGSLITAHQAAGFLEVSPNAKRYTDKEIIAAIKELAKHYRRMPTYHELRRASIAGKCPSPGTITRRIGKLREISSQVVA